MSEPVTRDYLDKSLKSNSENIAKLLTEMKESLEREIADLRDELAPPLKRHTGMMISGTVAISTLTRSVNTLETRLNKLQVRMQKLEKRKSA